MNTKKTFTYIILAVIFCFIGFGGGYLIGINSIPSHADEKITKQTTPSLESYNPEPFTENTSEENSDYDEKYLLKNENGVLTLYRISDEVTSIIKSIEFNSSFLPSEDRTKLEKGIYFDNIEQGFSLIEDFTSWIMRKQAKIKDIRRIQKHY